MIFIKKDYKNSHVIIIKNDQRKKKTKNGECARNR